MPNAFVEAGREVFRTARENPEKTAAVVGTMAVTGVVLDVTLRGQANHFMHNIWPHITGKNKTEIIDAEQEADIEQ